MPTNIFSVILGIQKFNTSISFDYVHNVLNHVFIVCMLILEC